MKILNILSFIFWVAKIKREIRRALTNSLIFRQKMLGLRLVLWDIWLMILNWNILQTLKLYHHLSFISFFRRHYRYLCIFNMYFLLLLSHLCIQSVHSFLIKLSLAFLVWFIVFTQDLLFIFIYIFSSFHSK